MSNINFVSNIYSDSYSFLSHFPFVKRCRFRIQYAFPRDSEVFCLNCYYFCVQSLCDVLLVPSCIFYNYIVEIPILSVYGRIVQYGYQRLTQFSVTQLHVGFMFIKPYVFVISQYSFFINCDVALVKKVFLNASSLPRHVSKWVFVHGLCASLSIVRIILQSLFVPQCAESFCCREKSL